MQKCVFHLLLQQYFFGMFFENIFLLQFSSKLAYQSNIHSMLAYDNGSLTRVCYIHFEYMYLKMV